jgi:MerR family transcriptional regulator, redox-sensitive transcriptional activator SoxR
MRSTDLLSIGEVSDRTGLSVPTIRYYEQCGFVRASRTAGGSRRFARSDIRRLSFVMLLQSFGLSLEDIRAAMANLPLERAPRAADWRRVSGSIRDRLDQRIAELERTRDMLDQCIGCGCLSLSECALHNHGDRARRRGSGAQYVLRGRF